MKNKITIFCTLISAALFSQVSNTGFADTSGGQRIGKVTIGGYLDSYYAFNFSKPSDDNSPYFVLSNRHNEANINLAFVDLRCNNENIRARITPGFGTYVNANYTAEQGVLKNIIEASAGLRISKKKNYWLDYGVIGSPFTNESYLSKDHLVYSRTLGAENVPYYLCGAKLSMPLSNKTNLYLYALNGWQQIRNQNKRLSFASQLEFRSNDKNLINWNTYIGDESSVTNPQFKNRYFSDVYWIYDSGKKFSSTACAFLGIQEIASSRFTWWQINYSAKYNFNTKLSLAGRVEYFNDPTNIMVTNITPTKGFSTSSASLCLNVKINDNALFRLENRAFYAKENAFICNKGIDTKFLNWAMANITVWF
ncbi:MAG: outer membrane beta-barrel protein [Flavobacteriales bacterium]